MKLKAGVASAVITPEEPMWLAGLRRDVLGRRQGKATELYAKCWLWKMRGKSAGDFDGGFDCDAAGDCVH